MASLGLAAAAGAEPPSWRWKKAIRSHHRQHAGRPDAARRLAGDVLHSRFPEHDLVVRNLGFSGDELTLRLRSADFGSPDEQLAAVKADVSSPSSATTSRSPARRASTSSRRTSTTSSSTRSARSTTASGARGSCSSRRSPTRTCTTANLPDGTENNERLELYTAAMAEVAEANGVAVRRPVRAHAGRCTPRRPTPLTINGIHLNEHGNRQLAQVIDEALFADGRSRARSRRRWRSSARPSLDKNFHWFNRYRTTDGYSIFGGRADLKFVDGQTNRVVMQREMEVLDVMTANRDKRIWAVAQGEDLEVDDSNTPPFIPVETNKPGPRPGRQARLPRRRGGDQAR